MFERSGDTRGLEDPRDSRDNPQIPTPCGYKLDPLWDSSSWKYALILLEQPENEIVIWIMKENNLSEFCPIEWDNVNSSKISPGSN